MNWVLEGMHVTATYLDEFQVAGRVELSRVAYGGRVVHTVVLDEPIQVYNRIADRLIVDHRDIQTVKDIN